MVIKLSHKLINNLSVDNDLCLRNCVELGFGPIMLSLLVQAKKLLLSIS